MARIKMRRPFHSTLFMKFNVLEGESEFTVRGGGLTVVCDTYWQTRSPGFTDFTVQPINTHFAKPNGEAKIFHVGVFTQIWTDLWDGEYYLKFRVRDHSPQYLRGIIRVS